ncbi:MAG: HAMP domain-containing histidine kinase [bacterium]|nr:HAMP domain-containing histidine kinase [bacterium]
MGNVIKNSSIFPLFENYPNMYVKQTVSSLFKTLLETVMDVRTESVIILKSSTLENIDGILTRLSYSNAKIFTFANNAKYNNFHILDERKNVFEEDFLLIFSERFSVVLAWAPTDTKGFVNACTSLNAGIINNIYEVMKVKADYKEVVNEVNKFNLDRRGNVMFDTILNKLMLKVEDYQRDLICANTEIGEYNILEEKDVRNILKNYSHELRNPVGMLGVYWKILSGYIEKIENGDKSSEPFEMVENATGVINSALENIGNTLGEMSNYTRDFKLNITEENLCELVEKVVDFALPSFKQKGVNLLLNIKQEPLIANIDKNKIYQVMLNLLKNALEATSEGKSVYVTLDEADGEIIIKVKDEGSGIKPEILPKIFRAYFTTKADGSGIGLSLSKEIIEKHRGELTLISNSDNGCEFQINIR